MAQIISGWNVAAYQSRRSTYASSTSTSQGSLVYLYALEYQEPTYDGINGTATFNWRAVLYSTWSSTPFYNWMSSSKVQINNTTVIDLAAISSTQCGPKTASDWSAVPKVDSAYPYFSATSQTLRMYTVYHSGTVTINYGLSKEYSCPFYWYIPMAFNSPAWYVPKKNTTALSASVTFPAITPTVIKPTVSAVTTSSITSTGASASFSITHNGYGTITASGIQFSTTNFGTAVKSISGTSGSVTGLTRYTTYYVRAYATNSAGTTYSAVTSFTTLAQTPTISAVNISSITRSSAAASFSVTDNGGKSITDYYIDCFTDSGCTNKVGTISAASGTFSGLTSNKTYYARANASNGSYRGYSAVKSFITTHNAPSIGSRTFTYTRAATSLRSTYSVVFTYSVTYDNAAYSSRKIEYGTSTSYGSSVNNTKTISGLAPNTTYYYRITETDNGASSTTSATATGSFTTPGISPTINSISASNITRTTASINFSGAYDTNASWGGCEVQYGTSTNYGTTLNDNASLTNLSANTTYYVKGRFRDNWGRWSGYATTSFKTTGNAPTLNSVSVTPARTTCTFSENVSYDTNASFSSVTISYGTTTGYGSTSTNNTISGLLPNTTYYYSVVVKDNQNRTSNAKTGSFKTTANSPTMTRAGVVKIDVDNAMLEFVATPDTNVSISKYVLYTSGGVYVTENTNGIFTVTGLSSETSYSYYCIATDNLGKTVQSGTVTFTTLTTKFIHYMDKTTNKLLKLVGIGDLKNFINHINMEIGGLSFATGRSYTLACTNSTSTTSMRSNLISIANTTLNNKDACFIQSTLFSWKIQHYDSNGNGLSEITGNIGEAAVINFADKNGYIAIEIMNTDLNKIKSSTKLYGCGVNDLSNILNNNKKIQKNMLETDIVKVSKYMRYIDVGSSGSNQNTYSHICELEVYDVDGINRARGILPTLIKGNYIVNGAYATDGNTATDTYVDIDGVNTVVRFDLGAIYEISHVKLWRYYGDNRTYYKTFCYGRSGDRPEDDLHDGELCYKFHDYKRDGEYAETSTGKTWYVEKEVADASTPIINSFTANTTQWTNQGVVLTILAEDNNGTDNLIYSFDGGINWTKKNTITVFKNKTYTAVVKDKKGNISTTNPTIDVNNVDLLPPTEPYVIFKENNIDGKWYRNGWTNQSVYIDIKEGLSVNLCRNLIERGYIDKETGIDDNDLTKTRDTIKMSVLNIETLYIQKYNYNNIIDDGVVTLYFYNENDEYLGYYDIDFINPYVNPISGSSYCRLADTSSNLENYYLVATSDVPVEYIDYYDVRDDLSGIKGWYYKISEDSNTYLPITNGQIFENNINMDMYIIARDNAGNSSVILHKEMRIDKDAPRDVRIACTKEGNNLHVLATAVDDTSGIKDYRFTIDGGETWTDYQESNEYIFKDLNGIYTVDVEVRDMANNIGIPDDWIVISVGDTSEYPVITEITGNHTTWSNQNCRLQIYGEPGSGAPEGTTIVEYSFSNGYDWSNKPTKVYSDNTKVYCRVKDSNGKMSDTFMVDINYIDKIPPTLNIPSGNLGVAMGSTADVWQGITYYDNDSGMNEALNTASITDTSNLDLGEHEVEYSVTDNAGNTSTKFRTIVVVGSVPTDTLYPREDLYPEDLPLPSSELAQYTHKELSQYKLSDIKGGSI